MLKKDNYFKDLKLKYYIYLHKHQLEKAVISIQFFKHRLIIFLHTTVAIGKFVLY
jgi:hypothetical protein